jgi:hypothetical protein
MSVFTQAPAHIDANRTCECECPELCDALSENATGSEHTFGHYQTCADDLHGELAAKGYDCLFIMGMINAVAAFDCQTAGQQLYPMVPAGYGRVSDLCPESCNVCGGGPAQKWNSAFSCAAEANSTTDYWVGEVWSVDPGPPVSMPGSTFNFVNRGNTAQMAITDVRNLNGSYEMGILTDVEEVGKSVGDYFGHGNATFGNNYSDGEMVTLLLRSNDGDVEQHVHSGVNHTASISVSSNTSGILSFIDFNRSSFVTTALMDGNYTSSLIMIGGEGNKTMLGFLNSSVPLFSTDFLDANISEQIINYSTRRINASHLEFGWDGLLISHGNFQIGSIGAQDKRTLLLQSEFAQLAAVAGNGTDGNGTDATIEIQGGSGSVVTDPATANGGEKATLTLMHPRCDGATWAGTQAACEVSAGTCAGASPSIFGTTTKADCDDAATTPGTFTSTATFGSGFAFTVDGSVPLQSGPLLQLTDAPEGHPMVIFGPTCTSCATCAHRDKTCPAADSPPQAAYRSALTSDYGDWKYNQLESYFDGIMVSGNGQIGLRGHMNTTTVSLAGNQTLELSIVGGGTLLYGPTGGVPDKKWPDCIDDCTYFNSLELAAAHCDTFADCKGVTQTAVQRFETRAGTAMVDSPEEYTSFFKVGHAELKAVAGYSHPASFKLQRLQGSRRRSLLEAAPVTFSLVNSGTKVTYDGPHSDSLLTGNIGGPLGTVFPTLQQAQSYCERLGGCGGVTQTSPTSFAVRAGTEPEDALGATSWVKKKDFSLTVASGTHTCAGAAWAGTQTECEETAGTCAGASPDIPDGTCDGAAWAGTQTECEESVGTCAGASPDIPDGTCGGAAWAGTQAACEESAGTCAGADPDVPGTTTKTLCDDAATTPGTFTSSATHVLTPTTKTLCDDAATTPGTFSSTATYVLTPTTKALCDDAATTPGTFTTSEPPYVATPLGWIEWAASYWLETEFVCPSDANQCTATETSDAQAAMATACLKPPNFLTGFVFDENSPTLSASATCDSACRPAWDEFYYCVQFGLDNLPDNTRAQFVAYNQLCAAVQYGTCDGAPWAGTETECAETAGTCAGASPDIPDGTCDAAAWAGTQTACEESAGTCAGADPGIPGTTTKTLCDAAAVTPGTFTSSATYVLTPTTKTLCDAATTPGTFSSTATYVTTPSACSYEDVQKLRSFGNYFSLGDAYLGNSTSGQPNKVTVTTPNGTAGTTIASGQSDDAALTLSASSSPEKILLGATYGGLGESVFTLARTHFTAADGETPSLVMSHNNDDQLTLESYGANGSDITFHVLNGIFGKLEASNASRTDVSVRSADAQSSLSLLGAGSTQDATMRLSVSKDSTCDGAAWAGTQAACEETAGTCAGASPDVPGTTTKSLCDAAAITPGTFTSTATYADPANIDGLPRLVLTSGSKMGFDLRRNIPDGTCDGVAWAGTEAACDESAGTCAGADPDVPGTTTKSDCDAAAATPGTFTSSATYVLTPTTSMSSTLRMDIDNVTLLELRSIKGTCDGPAWAGTQTECEETAGTCAGASPDIPDGTCDAAAWAGTQTECEESVGTCAGASPDIPDGTCDGAAWVGTQAACEESAGTCAGADPDVPGTTTKADCDDAATTPGTFTSSATYVLTPTTKTLCDDAATPGTFSSTATYVLTPTTKALCDDAATTPGTFTTSATYVATLSGTLVSATAGLAMRGTDGGDTRSRYAIVQSQDTSSMQVISNSSNSSIVMQPGEFGRSQVLFGERGFDGFKGSFDASGFNLFAEHYESVHCGLDLANSDCFSLLLQSGCEDLVPPSIVAANDCPTVVAELEALGVSCDDNLLADYGVDSTLSDSCPVSCDSCPGAKASIALSTESFDRVPLDGVATESSQYLLNGKDLAFDNDNLTFWDGCCIPVGQQWLGYTQSKAYPVVGYALQTGYPGTLPSDTGIYIGKPADHGEYPTAWNFQGRNADSDPWVTIDAQTDQPMLLYLTYFTFSNTLQYRQFRWEFISVAGGDFPNADGNGVVVREARLMERGNVPVFSSKHLGVKGATLRTSESANLGDTVYDRITLNGKVVNTSSIVVNSSAIQYTLQLPSPEAACDGAAWAGTQAECFESAGSCAGRVPNIPDGTCDGAGWTGTQTECAESAGTCGGASPDIPDGTCGGAAWAGTQAACEASAGTCAGADPDVPGTTTKADCVDAATTPGTFTSSATYVLTPTTKADCDGAATPGTFTSTATYVLTPTTKALCDAGATTPGTFTTTATYGTPTCERTDWSGTETECAESAGTCAGEDPEIPEGTCDAVLWSGTQTACEETAGTCAGEDPEIAEGTCDGAAWTGSQPECAETAGTCAGASPDIPDGTCDGAAWAGTRAACEETAGTCAGADPDVPGTTTKTLCDDAAVTPGTFTSSATYVLTPTTKTLCDDAATPGTFSSTAIYITYGTCDGAAWTGTQTACDESVGTCAGASPDIPDGTCDAAAWAGTQAACDESAGTCAGADPDIPGTTTKTLCDDAAVTPGTFTSSATYVLTPTTKADCDGAATPGTFSSTATYLSIPTTKTLCDGAATTPGTFTTTARYVSTPTSKALCEAAAVTGGTFTSTATYGTGIVISFDGSTPGMLLTNASDISTLIEVSDLQGGNISFGFGAINTEGDISVNDIFTGGSFVAKTDAELIGPLINLGASAKITFGGRVTAFQRGGENAASAAARDAEVQALKDELRAAQVAAAFTAPNEDDFRFDGSAYACHEAVNWDDTHDLEYYCSLANTEFKDTATDRFPRDACQATCAQEALRVIRVAVGDALAFTSLKLANNVTRMQLPNPDDAEEVMSVVFYGEFADPYLYPRILPGNRSFIVPDMPLGGDLFVSSTKTGVVNNAGIVSVHASTGVIELAVTSGLVPIEAGQRREIHMLNTYVKTTSIIIATLNDAGTGGWPTVAAAKPDPIDGGCIIVVENMHGIEAAGNSALYPIKVGFTVFTASDEHAAKDVDDCDPNPCQNSGTCVDYQFGHSCDCAGAFTGEDCSVALGGESAWQVPPTGR